jgi:hypothetical protein
MFSVFVPFAVVFFGLCRRIRSFVVLGGAALHLLIFFA